MIKDMAKVIKGLLKAQQEQTEALLKTQAESMNSKLKAISEIVYRTNLTFSNYVSRYEKHFTSSIVTIVSDKKSKFLCWVGTDTFVLLGKVFPDFQKASYDKIVKQLLLCFCDECHFIDARIEFTRCAIKHGQSSKQCVAEQRNEIIRDAVIIRTPNKNIQSTLLLIKNPCLDQVVSVAKSTILTSKTMEAIQKEDSATIVNRKENKKVEPTRQTAKL
ncbi:hypothetical protein RF11_13339 [Thelohanellus kitauei]|uniref:Uncharacterized protein n=1 Tax=Thelohanellus kitauei TaxID=669202 RepID=A0A0C2M0V1_THEKT|nr:hypothetical protein RF11_13339 [Thelohanellus kitauei]